VAHEDPDHLVALLEQEPGGHAAIDAAGHGKNHAGHANQGIPITKDAQCVAEFAPPRKSIRTLKVYPHVSLSESPAMTAGGGLILRTG